MANFTTDPYWMDNTWGKKAVQFNQLDPMTQISHTRNEFVRLIKNLFESPELLKHWITEKRITNDQAKLVIAAIDKLSRKNCYCCKRFDQFLLAMTPIENEFQPILEIAKQTVKEKLY